MAEVTVMQLIRVTEQGQVFLIEDMRSAAEHIIKLYERLAKKPDPDAESVRYRKLRERLEHALRLLRQIPSPGNVTTKAIQIMEGKE